MRLCVCTEAQRIILWHLWMILRGLFIQLNSISHRNSKTKNNWAKKYPSCNNAKTITNKHWGEPGTGQNSIQKLRLEGWAEKTSDSTTVKNDGKTGENNCIFNVDPLCIVSESDLMWIDMTIHFCNVLFVSSGHWCGRRFFVSGGGLRSKFKVDVSLSTGACATPPLTGRSTASTMKNSP